MNSRRTTSTMTATATTTNRVSDFKGIPLKGSQLRHKLDKFMPFEQKKIKSIPPLRPTEKKQNKLAFLLSLLYFLMTLMRVRSY